MGCRVYDVGFRVQGFGWGVDPKLKPKSESRADATAQAYTEISASTERLSCCWEHTLAALRRLP